MYDRNPTIDMKGMEQEAFAKREIANELIHKINRIQMQGKKKVLVVVDCYPGTDLNEIQEVVQGIPFAAQYVSDDCALKSEDMDELFVRNLTRDRVFGIMTSGKLEDCFDFGEINNLKKTIASIEEGIILIYGVGASLIARGDVLILAELTRWEIQLRYRKGMDNWRTKQTGLPVLSKYKRGYFIEWRLADRHKKQLYSKLDYYLDTNKPKESVMVTGDAYRKALKQTVEQPFRLVPYFDPGVWGGHWMKDTFDLPENGSNYAWSFDGVVEENSLIYQFGEHILETPAINLVFIHPVELLGSRVHARFGTEFPIRFDYLDTMGGQNLSLQVHPLTEYIQEQFHMNYTQDESYYILEAGKEACVYLGVQEGINSEDMMENLRKAEDGVEEFDVNKYINCFPVKQHDHVLIPAGTIHCSGRNTVVLEISATPYIFTFKLWDWNRVGLDGLPRPVHLEHGFQNIQWDRDTKWVESELLHQETVVHQEDGILVERTGLHEREFIDTYRFTLENATKIQRNGSVHVLNLIGGKDAVIRSIEGGFKDYQVHYGETFILPQAAGEYEIVPGEENKEIKVILACVR